MKKMCLMVCAPMLALANVFANEPEIKKESPPLPDFKISTSCDWQAEVRRTNTWLERDQKGRIELGKLIDANPSGVPREEYDRVSKALKEEESLLQAELEDLVMRCGWPSKTAFGNRAGENAWFVVQHAPPEFKIRYLPLVQAAAEAGELPKRMWATLYDRVQLSQGRPQRYGSQICDEGNGTRRVCDIESVEGIDMRRAEVGMVPVSWCAYLSMNGATHPICEVGAPASANSGKPNATSP
ncbi:DUF6624 domain-containing protein [Roseateles sp. DB2]|uniref:DUF6624 domain-containing protein n=1 Tax=Roseateles sp. DB2 TaxID=3453717 RepID=UPI003EEC19A9